MKIIKFVIDQKTELNIPCQFVARIGETLIINQLKHFVDDVVYDTGIDQITVYLLSTEL